MEKNRSRRVELIEKTNRSRMFGVLSNFFARYNLLPSLVLISCVLMMNIKLGSCMASFSSLYHSSSSSTNRPHIQANQYPIVQRCSNGAPLQWRAYLDVASKAHLAPNVVLGSLQHINLTPIQLSSSGQQSGSLLSTLSQQQRQQQLVNHPQSINNIGVNIEATFKVTKILKKSSTSNLRIAQIIKSVYKVSAPLSTTQALMKLVSSSGSGMNSSDSNTLHQNQALSGQLSYQSQYQQRQQQLISRSQQQQHHHHHQQQQATTCSLDLSELELVKKADKIFKMNQNYVLFLDQSSLSTSQQHHSQQQQQQQQQHSPEIKRVLSEFNRNIHQSQHLKEQQEQQVGAASSYLQSPYADFAYSVSLHPFATHELLTNQTSRALRKILCKNCAQVPQIQLLNSTFVQEQQLQSQVPNKIKLDCRVTGYPTPWIQWFRNGKLLRNKSGKLNIRTNKWKKRYNVRLSRLEIIQQVGKNDTGVYECRAMNVVAREPVVGEYTLLVLPTNYAIIPMQPSLVASSDKNSNSNDEDGSDTGSGGNNNNINININSINNNNNLANETIPTIEINSKVEESRPKTNTSPPTASVTSTTPTTVAPTSGSSSNGQGSSKTKGTSPANTSGIPMAIGPTTTAGQVPCPREVHDIYCLNKGTCVQIRHIAEFYCNCAEGYHGHRCEYKSSKPQKSIH